MGKSLSQQIGLSPNPSKNFIHSVTHDMSADFLMQLMYSTAAAPYFAANFAVSLIHVKMLSESGHSGIDGISDWA
ncbi:hypothetical protein DERF_002104 [Dermatophagoides farinae]|uniref:Uncharacterized protein n=1 Tax=Dermatophagoides farinae TaxID=6954 RepID=A0A922IF33_DERFA|nr:hypothetical protein DERF_002104 [Dermatophagoides farinae]